MFFYHTPEFVEAEVWNLIGFWVTALGLCGWIHIQMMLLLNSDCLQLSLQHGCKLCGQLQRIVMDCLLRADPRCTQCCTTADCWIRTQNGFVISHRPAGDLGYNWLNGTIWYLNPRSDITSDGSPLSKSPKKDWAEFTQPSGRSNARLQASDFRGGSDRVGLEDDSPDVCFWSFTLTETGSRQGADVGCSSLNRKDRKCYCSATGHLGGLWTM